MGAHDDIIAGGVTRVQQCLQAPKHHSNDDNAGGVTRAKVQRWRCVCAASASQQRSRVLALRSTAAVQTATALPADDQCRDPHRSAANGRSQRVADRGGRCVNNAVYTAALSSVWQNEEEGRCVNNAVLYRPHGVHTAQPGRLQLLNPGDTREEPPDLPQAAAQGQGSA